MTASLAMQLAMLGCCASAALATCSSHVSFYAVQTEDKVPDKVPCV